jgi:hypothetical protein
MIAFGRKMKGRLLKFLFAALLVLATLVIITIIKKDRTTWTAWHGVSVALRDARTVAVVEFVGQQELARKTCSRQEVSRLREAISRWWYPFFGSGYLCDESYHRIEMVMQDGSELTCFISFRCERMITSGETLPTAAMPLHIYKPLASFFESVGMKHTSAFYRKLELEATTPDAD